MNDMPSTISMSTRLLCTLNTMKNYSSHQPGPRIQPEDMPTQAEVDESTGSKFRWIKGDVCPI